MDTSRTSYVLAIGESLMDCVQPYGCAEPTAEYPGGSPANVAMTLGRLGQPVVLQTWLGDDARGQKIAEHFRASHVTIAEDSFGADHTSTALAILDETGAASYVFDFNWAPHDPITLSGDECVIHALLRAREHALVTYDPNARPSLMGEPEDALRTIERCVVAADLVKVSDEDIEWLTGTSNVEATVEKWLGMGPKVIIVTRGKDGAYAYAASGATAHVLPESVEVADTVGAGDSFMGGIIDALITDGFSTAEGRTKLDSITSEQLQSIVLRSTAIASITVSRSGANPPWAHELA